MKKYDARLTILAACSREPMAKNRVPNHLRSASKVMQSCKIRSWRVGAEVLRGNHIGAAAVS